MSDVFIDIGYNSLLECVSGLYGGVAQMARAYGSYP